MRIVLVSDSHAKHRKLRIPPADLLLHAGDITFDGEEDILRDFNNWLAELPIKHKVVIAGNHDTTLDPEHRRYREGYDKIITNAIYLNDSGCEIPHTETGKMLKIWGSPVQPWFWDWAFNRMRGDEIDEHWKLIPSDTDLLITHGPPHQILDRPHGTQPPVGCECLIRHVERIKPKLHVFGHIHGGYGVYKHNGTWFVNASVVNEAYMPVNEPVEFTYDVDDEMSVVWGTSEEGKA